MGVWRSIWGVGLGFLCLGWVVLFRVCCCRHLGLFRLLGYSRGVCLILGFLRVVPVCMCFFCFQIAGSFEFWVFWGLTQYSHFCGFCTLWVMVFVHLIWGGGLGSGCGRVWWGFVRAKVSAFCMISEVCNFRVLVCCFGCVC